MPDPGRCAENLARRTSLRWVRPMPPPTTTLNPLTVLPSGFMMTTAPTSLMYRSTELSPVAGRAA
eukprot:scaffold52223_cov30-Tisochrysis_lutea.AAC.5